jgi:hypothetical protein
VPTHFDIDRWTDFVRGLAGQTEHAEMEKHLAQGCTRCSRQVALLRRLAGSAAGIRATPEVPGHVVERALAMFQQAPRTRPERRRLIASMIFDSFAVPAAAGARGTRSGTRRLSYRADNFELELLADLDRRSQTVTITGQLSNRVIPGSVPTGVPVQLVSGRKVLRQTATNEFGEFQLDSFIAKGLTLRVAAAEAAPEIDVPLTPLWASRRSARRSSPNEKAGSSEPQE